ncbi:hypothetical protein B0H14DRAFT_704546 [Mycena olivaceomarginata]|nr:hypothetical protein B0H14DRAFT_704546 [Mycena olivaceomarginata]
MALISSIFIPPMSRYTPFHSPHDPSPLPSLYFSWYSQISSISLGNPTKYSSTTSMHPLGTVALGTRPFPHKVVLSMKSDEDSVESMKIGGIVAPDAFKVLGMIVRGLHCMIGPHSHLTSSFIPPCIGCAAQFVRMYLSPCVGVGGLHDRWSTPCQCTRSSPLWRR